MPAIDPLSDAAFSQAIELQQNPDAADKSLRVRFYNEEMPDDAKSAEMGRPMFRSVEMCEIYYGDKGNVAVDRVKSMARDPARDPRRRFPVQYAQFKAGNAEQHVGTLLREWGLMDRASAISYQAAGLYTVEELAGLSDVNAQNIRGSLADRQKARDFLDMAKGLAPLTQARAENQKMRDELSSMKEQLAELTSLLNQKTDPGKKGKA